MDLRIKLLNQDLALDFTLHHKLGLWGLYLPPVYDGRYDFDKISLELILKFKTNRKICMPYTYLTTEFLKHQNIGKALSALDHLDIVYPMERARLEIVQNLLSRCFVWFSRRSVTIPPSAQLLDLTAFI